MIPFDFEYHRPDTAADAVSQFVHLRQQGKKPVWYGGGTEILSRARLNKIETGAVIDLKAIPECTVLNESDGRLTIGSAVTLDKLYTSGVWPLLGEAANRVADHTIRCKITLGGHLGGNIKYREAVLPLLLIDCEAVVAGPDGSRTVPFGTIFNQTYRLAPGEFLVQVLVPVAVTRLPYFFVKRTRLDYVDYPLLTVAAVRAGAEIRLAFSGLSDFPFRSSEMEAALNAPGAAAEDRAQGAVASIPHPVPDDTHGSAAYRRFVLGNTLRDVLAQLGPP